MKCACCRVRGFVNRLEHLPRERRRVKLEAQAVKVEGGERDSRVPPPVELPRVVITSDDVNYLIYRYLQESGFKHSAFTFASEGMVLQGPKPQLPPGQLVHFLQKGLQYSQIETHLCEDGSIVKCDAEFSLVEPHVCSVKQPEPAETMVVDAEANSVDEAIDAAPRDVLTLRGHAHESYTVAFHPRDPDLLASGAADGTARLWKSQPYMKSNGSLAKETMMGGFAVLMNSEEIGARNFDVIALDWNHDGTILASGNAQGQVRLWDCNGNPLRTLLEHKGAISGIKFNDSGNYLLTSGLDKVAIVWDAEVGIVLQRFADHAGPLMDVDWQNNIRFAVCGCERTVWICEVGKSRPVVELFGHTDDVNCLRWSPNRSLLASASDDTNVMIWDPETPARPRATLTGHLKEAYSVCWGPCGRGTANPNADLSLASTSYDGTVKLWDPETGALLHTLQHKEAVYAVQFHHSGKYVASGGFDQQVLVWSTKDGSLVRRCRCGSGIFDLSWGPRSDRLAVATRSGEIKVIEVRM